MYDALYKTILIIAALAFFMTCATAKADQPWPEPRPLGSGIPTFAAPAQPPATDSRQRTIEAPSETIAIDDALKRALMHNPELAASSWEVRSGEARTTQAGLLPNPEIEVEVENFGGSRGEDDQNGGSDTLKRFEGAETTVALSQLIELGGKRSKRKRVAESEHSLRKWDLEVKRLDTITDVSGAFINLLALQERMDLTNGLVDLAQDVYNTVSERVKAGKVSPIEATRAHTALATIQIEQERATRELETGRRHLAATWGSDDPGFQRVTGNLEAISAPPPYEFLLSRIDHNPDIARWDDELGQREAALSLEKSQRYPDLTIAGGVKYLEESNDQTYLMRVSLPIPLVNRNQGAVREAIYNLQKARDERAAAAVKTRTALNESYQTLLFAYAETTTLRDTILPGAESAFNATNEGYRAGKFSYLDVLDVQRSLFDAKDTYLSSLLAYHKALTAIERLTGEALSAIETPSTH
jgi:cobalt-zinc-cadmium efflux system outer membrane protein